MGKFKSSGGKHTGAAKKAKRGKQGKARAAAPETPGQRDARLKGERKRKMDVADEFPRSARLRNGLPPEERD